MANSLTDRALLLIEKSSLNDLTRAGQTDYNRWVNIKRGRARVGADEIEVLAAFYPSYRWWLLTGETKPSDGQTSPDYDEANTNLSNPSVG
ncbi:DNA-binding protein [Pseudomonas nicosulfuronedens]|nr:DNA-binding protein [Pseudomonas nicosulfuronedens]MDH1008319.1 DNA-binding protein [Pseudomonas nicosulfuronedens]MDH1979277.1 DNA-binding protein [Pseudomonas nicosulfuronedens]MDH2027275.1 DNA-binding protein [Pseudomonas nicosulfuronedens]